MNTLKLVGTEEKFSYKNFKKLLENEETYNAKASTPYGDGHAFERIAHILCANQAISGE